MVLKTVLLLLVLTVCQVIATSILHLRSLGSVEILEARQSCTVCTTVANLAGNCTTVACVCNSDVAAMVQDCVNCALAGDPTATAISSAQNLIDVYARACDGVPGVPAITRPAGIPAPPSSSVGGSPSIVAPTPTTTRPVPPVTITTAGAPSPIVQSTVDSIPTSSDTGGGLPPVVTNGAEQGIQSDYAVIGVLLGVVLLL